MKNFLNLCVGAIASLTLISCDADFYQLLVDGKYKEAEKCIKKMKGIDKYNCAETLIKEYIEIEEYDRAVYVYEKCTPEHCDNSGLKYPSLYCHGSNYELTVTSLFRKIFTDIGDYGKVWQYSVWEYDGNSGDDAEAYYPRSCIVSGLMFRSLIHFEFIFVYGVRKCRGTEHNKTVFKLGPDFSRRLLADT